MYIFIECSRDPSIYTMDHPKFIISNQKEESIILHYLGYKRTNMLLNYLYDSIYTWLLPMYLQIVCKPGPSRHMKVDNNRPTSETPFKWRFAGRAMVARNYSIYCLGLTFILRKQLQTETAMPVVYRHLYQDVLFDSLATVVYHRIDDVPVVVDLLLIGTTKVAVVARIDWGVHYIHLITRRARGMGFSPRHFPKNERKITSSPVIDQHLLTHYNRY